MVKSTNSPNFSKAQERKFKRVMNEFSTHTLHAGSARGPIVKRRNQAIAIAFSEANSLKKKRHH